MSVPGPAELGRSVVVTGDAPPPHAWRDRPEVAEIEVADESCVDALHHVWATRTPAVIRLRTDPAFWRVPADLVVEPWTVPPGLDLPGDRLHHLLWVNSYDARSGDPVWWWTRKAERLGARAGATTDVELPDGTAAWIDGGPRAPLGVAHIHAETVELGSLRLAPLPCVPSRRSRSPPTSSLRSPMAPARRASWPPPGAARRAC